MKLKLRKIGNSYGVILPHNVITSYKEGAEIEINVITSNDSVITKTANVITNEPNVITSRPNVITKPTNVITDGDMAIPIKPPKYIKDKTKRYIFNEIKGIYELK